MKYNNVIVEREATFGNHSDKEVKLSQLYERQ